MTRVLDRIRGKRIGLFGLILLVLLILVIAHALIMGVGHSEEAACGSCVVVIATGLAAVIALRPHRSVPAFAGLLLREAPVLTSPARPVRPPPLRTTVLRL